MIFLNIGFIQLMSSVLRKWPKQLNLRNLIIEFAFDGPWKEAFILNLQTQRQWLLDVVSAQFPALHSCRFDMAFWWRYDLVKEKWQTEANPEFCGTLLEFLKASDYKEGDCEGFLENLVNASGKLISLGRSCCFLLANLLRIILPYKA